jgi:hypothetical protein
MDSAPPQTATATATATSIPTAPLISWLDAPQGVDDPQPPAPALLGGKGASLVRLVRAGLPVPPGFVILPAAFAAPAAGPGPSPEASLADGAGPQIEAAYAELGRRLGVADPPVAVRSSAVAEDLAGASFAGLYDTYLGVAGAGEVRRAAARCAASLWGVAVEAYRRSLEGAGKSLPAPSMAVVVQALVAADAAGVAFTVDPLSPEGRPLVVNASWGLGQSIVDGVVEGDSWRLDRETLAITHQTIGDKPDRTPETADGPRLPVPEADRRRPSLQPEQVADVARLALQAEAVLGCPADVEWALSGSHPFPGRSLAAPLPKSLAVLHPFPGRPLRGLDPGGGPGGRRRQLGRRGQPALGPPRLPRRGKARRREPGRGVGAERRRPAGTMGRVRAGHGLRLLHRLGDGLAKPVASGGGEGPASQGLRHKGQRGVVLARSAGAGGGQSGPPAELVKLRRGGLQGPGQGLHHRLVRGLAVAPLQLGDVGVVHPGGGRQVAHGQSPLAP